MNLSWSGKMFSMLNVSTSPRCMSSLLPEHLFRWFSVSRNLRKSSELLWISSYYQEYAFNSNFYKIPLEAKIYENAKPHKFWVTTTLRGSKEIKTFHTLGPFQWLHTSRHHALKSTIFDSYIKVTWEICLYNRIFYLDEYVSSVFKKDLVENGVSDEVNPLPPHPNIEWVIPSSPKVFRPPAYLLWSDWCPNAMWLYL